MPIVAKNISGIGDVYEWSGVITSNVIQNSLASILNRTTGVYTLPRHIYLHPTVDLRTCHGGFTFDLNNYDFIQHSNCISSDHVTWKNFIFLRTVGRSIPSRFNTYREFDGTRILDPYRNNGFGLCLEDSSWIFNVVGRASSGGDRRYLEETPFGQQKNSNIFYAKHCVNPGAITPVSETIFRGVKSPNIYGVGSKDEQDLIFINCHFRAQTEGGQWQSYRGSKLLLWNSSFRANFMARTLNYWADDGTGSIVILGEERKHTKWGFGPNNNVLPNMGGTHTTGAKPMKGGIYLKFQYLGMDAPVSRVYDSRAGVAVPATDVELKMDFSVQAFTTNASSVTGDANGISEMLLFSTNGTRVRISAVSGHKIVTKKYGYNIITQSIDIDSSEYLKSMLDTDLPKRVASELNPVTNGVTEASIRALTQASNYDEIAQLIHILALDTNRSDMVFDNNLHQIVDGDTLDVGSLGLVLDHSANVVADYDNFTQMITIAVASTLEEGTIIKKLKGQSITFADTKNEGLYETPTGKNCIVKINDVPAGASVAFFDADNNLVSGKYYANVAGRVHTEVFEGITADVSIHTIIVKKQGEKKQPFIVDVADSRIHEFNYLHEPIIQATGASSYTEKYAGSLITPVVNGSTVEMRIGDGEVSAQELMNATEDFLVTQAGMKFLEADNNNCNLFISELGSVIFYSKNWRLERRAADNHKARVNAIFFSEDGSNYKSGNIGDVTILNKDSVDIKALFDDLKKHVTEMNMV